MSRIVGGAPLVVGANRDELYERPASPMAVLRAAGPRVLGGRDELAGGTWLAVNEAGVFAGVTNRPTGPGRDPAKRSRGELPLLLTRHRSAAQAVSEFEAGVDPASYNPCWILVGDRRSLFVVDISDSSTLAVDELPPGLHVLENRPLGAPSVKADRVLPRLAGAGDRAVGAVMPFLRAALADHELPAAAGTPAASPDGPSLPEADAACVHSDRYGTRWSGLLAVRHDPDEPPELHYADGPPCISSYRDASSLWQAP